MTTPQQPEISTADAIKELVNLAWQMRERGKFWGQLYHYVNTSRPGSVVGIPRTAKTKMDIEEEHETRSRLRKKAFQLAYAGIRESHAGKDHYEVICALDALHVSYHAFLRLLLEVAGLSPPEDTGDKGQEDS